MPSFPQASRKCMLIQLVFAVNEIRQGIGNMRLGMHSVD